VTDSVQKTGKECKMSTEDIAAQPCSDWQVPAGNAMEQDGVWP
jgi:hypothetical protein